MKTILARTLSVVLATIFALSPAFATCGGGGGGGVGGASSGSGANPIVYSVPWKARAAKDAPAAGLVLYWFPATQEEVQKSSLRESRALTLYSAQCVLMELADYREGAGQKLIGDSKPPLALLATPDGTVIGKVENTGGKLKVGLVEKLVETEVKKREEALDASIKEGRDKLKAGDNQSAVKLFGAVAGERCMFPKKAKEAAGELKKLGVTGIAGNTNAPSASPIFEPRQSLRIERTMRAGLRAEMASRYAEAGRLYDLAHRLDPADPVPMRFLGELYRHHTGEWDKARATFEALLSMPADPLSRSVALHGLGKMTIHEGEFKKGLSLMEQAVAAYPLALAYRNLAVYWNSEGDATKTAGYVRQALAVDPKDPYNLIFAAAYMAGSGRGAEALKIARENERLLPASYNLAAVYAQTGHRDKALALLRRHFFEYERYRAVRSKEMMEARVDAVFNSIREDASFVSLTDGADGRLPLPMKPAGANR